MDEVTINIKVEDDEPVIPDWSSILSAGELFAKAVSQFTDAGKPAAIQLVAAFRGVTASDLSSILYAADSEAVRVVIETLALRIKVDRNSQVARWKRREEEEAKRTAAIVA